ncbi:oxygen-independent coproporphyrinogen-3 oxidase [Dysgonomonadaceae bacterium PH5-43]|nr:oxygen-independent coproporphyrinogen-3 oxidase [Dysgonomonadaceae bacterium PH5-43]
MAGIYIHIPFCRTRCAYCDFFSSTDMAGQDRYVSNIVSELIRRKDYLGTQPVNTVYFGGGTPSLLSPNNLETIFDCINNNFEVDWINAETSIEVNPDDISSEYLEGIKHLPVNRISMGVQSFDDVELKFLNRRHSARSAMEAVKLCRQSGYNNISIDLMYGLPNQTVEGWKKNVRRATELNIEHVSAYHLIYEEGTALYNMLSRGLVTETDEEVSNIMFEALIDMLGEAGFEQYEISNFGKSGFYSRHNSSYWSGSHYLGVGASAHSYNGVSRQWNRDANNYLDFAPELELIDEKTAYNDFVITRLRTMRGIDLEELGDTFGDERLLYLLKQAERHLRNQTLTKDSFLRLTRKGIFVSDGIMSDLML